MSSTRDVQAEAIRLLDEFDRYAGTPPDNAYVGSPFQAEVRAFLAAHLDGSLGDGS